MQYYLELDPEIPDVYFESSAFAGAGQYLDSIADQLKIKSVFELFSYAAQNDLCPPGYEETEAPWFDPQEGIDWLEVVIAHVRANPTAVERAERLVEDLTECQDVLRQAKAAGSKVALRDGYLAVSRRRDNESEGWPSTITQPASKRCLPLRHHFDRSIGLRAQAHGPRD
jgi:hypothetical protein